MSDHIIALIGGIIIGIIVTLISLFVSNKPENKPHGHKSGNSSSDDSFWEIKKELESLQEQIDEIKRKKRSVCASISSGYDYKSACEELDITDFDLLHEWDRRGLDYYENCEEATKFQDKLNDFDKILEGDNINEIKRVLEKLDDLCFNNPEDVELLYRIGRAHVRLSEGKSNDEVKKHVEKGMNALSTALNLNNKHAEVHKWYAISLGLRSQFQPLLEKAKDGLLFKKHCDLASALKPKDAVLHHLLGRFDYEIASLGWFEKTMAKPFLGESLNSTYTDALKRFMTAEKLSVYQKFSIKEKKENKTMLGKTLIALEKKQEAVKWFVQAKRLGPTDITLDKELDSLLAKYI